MPYYGHGRYSESALGSFKADTWVGQVMKMVKVLPYIPSSKSKLKFKFEVKNKPHDHGYQLEASGSRPTCDLKITYFVSMDQCNKVASPSGGPH